MFINQVQLVSAALPRDTGEALFQVWCLKRNTLEPLLTIPPVDPPGQALSQPSFAVVDEYGFTLCHLLAPLLGLGEPEQLLEFRTVKADHHLAVNDRDRRCPHAQLQELPESLPVFPDILFDELYTLLRKKLSLLCAGRSPRLGIHDHLFRHYVPRVMFAASR